MNKLILLVVFLSLAGCVPSAKTVRLDTPLLEGLTVEAETDDTHKYTTKMTHWREPDSGKLKACLRVTSLKGQYASSGMFFIKTPDNTPRAGVHDIHLDEALSSINVTEEGKSSNKVGKLQYLRLADSAQQCAYLMQYSGSTARFENQSQLLGTTKIEAWYCDDALSQDTVNAFIDSVTF
jgi:hypothetical protein